MTTKAIHYKSIKWESKRIFDTYIQMDALSTSS